MMNTRCKSSLWHQPPRRLYSLSEDIDCDLLSFVSHRCHEASSSLPMFERTETPNSHSEFGLGSERPSMSAKTKEALVLFTNCLPPDKQGELKGKGELRFGQTRQRRQRSDHRMGNTRIPSSGHITSGYEDVQKDNKQCSNKWARGLGRNILKRSSTSNQQDVVSSLANPTRFHNRENYAGPRDTSRHGEYGQGDRTKLLAHNELHGLKLYVGCRKRKRKKRSFLELPTGSQFDSLIRNGAFERYMMEVTKR